MHPNDPDNVWRDGEEDAARYADVLEQRDALLEAMRLIASQRPEPSNSPDPKHENYLRRTLISIATKAIAEAALSTEGGE